jgi:hypothetical protein
MDSAVLGLASPVMVDVRGTVLVFEQEPALGECQWELLLLLSRCLACILFNNMPLGPFAMDSFINPRLCSASYSIRCLSALHSLTIYTGDTVNVNDGTPLEGARLRLGG